MKFNVTFGLFENVLCSLVKKEINDKNVMKKIKKEYRAVIDRAGDIGSDNMLLASYALAAFFIAMNRNDNKSADENIEIIASKIENNKLVKKLLGGDADTYFSEKKMEGRREWSKKTHERKYEDDWVVDVIEKDDNYDMGLDYTRCGVCEMCKKEGCFEWAKYLCKLDFMLVEMIGIKLDRKGTLAEGADKCDFRFKRQ